VKIMVSKILMYTVDALALRDEEGRVKLR